jgi:Domain of unknown function (DUF4190)
MSAGSYGTDPGQPGPSQQGGSPPPPPPEFSQPEAPQYPPAGAPNPPPGAPQYPQPGAPYPPPGAPQYPPAGAPNPPPGAPQYPPPGAQYPPPGAQYPPQGSYRYPVSPQFQLDYGARPMPVPRRTNSLAIAALSCGIGQVIAGPLTGIPAVILGAMSLNQIRQTGEDGHGMAVTGIVLGVVGTLLFVLFIVMFIGFANYAVHQAHQFGYPSGPP